MIGTNAAVRGTRHGVEIIDSRPKAAFRAWNLEDLQASSLIRRIHKSRGRSDWADGATSIESTRLVVLMTMTPSTR
jgi:hypothetical protein